MALIRRRSTRTTQPGAAGPRTPDDFLTPRGRIALRLTRIGIAWERLAAAFWPLATVLAGVVAALALGVVAALPDRAVPWAAGAALLAVVAAAVWGGWRYRPARYAEAVARLDRTLPGRPLSALADHAAIGGEGALWQAHLAQMATRAAQARAVRPDAGLARRDPYALRLAALVALVMAMVFGGAGQMGQGLSAIAATWRPATGGGPAGTSGPAWEGWAEPPAYTRRPTIYLNALTQDAPLTLPKGSVISLRSYGGPAAFTQTIGAVLDDDPAAPRFRAERSGTVEIAGRRIDVTVQPDAAPVIRAGTLAARRADGRMIQPFEARDDFGVTAASAVIALDLAAVDRRYGLATAPEPRPVLDLPLTLPVSGDRRVVQGQLAEDLSRHPWANLPVRVRLRAVDGIDQQGQSAPLAMVLPGRRFFDPLAAALIEMRRDLLWSRQNARRSAEILRALTWQPDGFVAPALYADLRGGVALLERGPLSDEARDKLAQALWQAAVQLEDGGLADALERMKQAQERLSEAIRNGASPGEVERLMDELKSATDAYIDMLAQQSPEQQADEPSRGQQQGQTITSGQIQQMMDEIQRLMNEGRMAEAQELLDQFNRMMENMQVQQGQAGEGEGQEGRGSQPMNRLADTLREQQDLSDQAFREMQRRFRQGQQGQQGEDGPQGQNGQQGQDGQGPQGPSGGDLAQRQQDLRQQLGQQRGLMPGQGSAQGDQARRSLDQAGRAMEDAEQALRDGDMAGAMQRQADAIESMREGMRALADMLNQDGQQQAGRQDQQPGQQPGEGQQGSGQRAGARDAPLGSRSVLDPLGRQQGGSGNIITGGDALAEGADPARRARDLQDEIRRRSAERDRPEDERDYLGRLLDRF